MKVDLVKNHFPFGNKYGMWEHESDFPSYWRDYFDYGYCTNKMKWAAVEKKEGVRDFTKGDVIRGQFDSWEIPLSGNTLLWEVEKWLGGGHPKDYCRNR